jgi:hypothetical protein
MPHRNDPATLPARRPHQNGKPAIQKSNGNMANFTVLASVIDARIEMTGKDLFRIGKIQTTLVKSLSALRLVPLVHGLMYIQKSARQGRRSRPMA